MTPRERDDDHDEPESEQGMYDDSPPRSIFAATWFRAVLILIVLGVVGAVAVPYILDAVNPPLPKAPVMARTPSPVPATPAPTTATPATPTPPAPPPPADKLPETDKSAATAAPPAPSTPQEANLTGPKSAPAKTATDTTPTSDKPQTAAKAETTRPDTTTPTTKRAAPRATATPAPRNGAWWVQVGAFKDEATAKRLADKLRADNFTVEQLTFTPAAARTAKNSSAPSTPGASAKTDQYDVLVSGLPAEDISKHLAAKGLSSRPSGGGVIVTPSLPLRDAVALSKVLAVDGLKVQVKRAGTGADAGASEAAKTAAAAPPSSGGETHQFYRVRVSGFTDRAAAQAAAKQLEAKGFRPFVGRG